VTLAQELLLPSLGTVPRLPICATADFKGDKAKLVWVVSLDGKKMQSETYKVLAVLGKR